MIYAIPLSSSVINHTLLFINREATALRFDPYRFAPTHRASIMLFCNSSEGIWS